MGEEMPNRQHQVENLYHAALERPANQRAAFLLEATAGDGALRREVESLLGQSPENSSPASGSLEVSREVARQQAQATDSTVGKLAELSTGMRLSHYRVLEKLGAGGMGVVYRAHDERLDRDVALKVLPADRLASDTARNGFRKEALALAKVNHPYIATIYDFDEQGGIDFLVMEYVPGTSLVDQLAHGSLPEDEVLSLGLQIAAALEEAHEHGIVHRDLKPGNIMVTPKRQAKVLDFGLAKLLRPLAEISTIDELSSFAELAGTLPYMAPEQLRGHAADPRTDIYAAGTVLYEMATGRRPFRAKFATALAADIQTKAPTHPSQVNPRTSLGLEQIILKCLEKDPEHRYQSAKELLVDLRRLSRAGLNTGRGWQRRRSLLVTALAGLVVITLSPAVYLARRQFWPYVKPPQGKVTLAVLPFENLSHDPQQDYFCDGLTDEMINQLGRLQPARMAVIARTSAMQYKGGQKRVDEIGRELGVGYILETGVRREGARVRISTQLIQVRDQTTLWSDKYDYDVAGVFAVESDVAARIASSLAIQLLPGQQAARPPTTNPAAYDAYLKGRYHWNKGSVEERRKAREYFEQSVRIDASYAPGYAELAGYYWSIDDLPPKLAMPQAKEYALKALELDDTLTQAHTALGGTRFYGDWDWSGAESEFKRALALNPNDAEAHRTYSNYLFALERFDEALLEVQHARELDPLSLFTSVNAGWTFYFARKYDGAIEQCKKALQLDANSDGAHACLGWSYRAKGLPEQAIAESELAMTLSRRDPTRIVGLARAYAQFGRSADAKKLLAELQGRAQHSYVPPYLFARIHAALGEEQQALASLEEAYAERDQYLVWLKVDDAFDPLRQQPRFQALIRRVGFPP